MKTTNMERRTQWGRMIKKALAESLRLMNNGLGIIGAVLLVITIFINWQYTWARVGYLIAGALFLLAAALEALADWASR